MNVGKTKVMRCRRGGGWWKGDLELERERIGRGEVISTWIYGGGKRGAGKACERESEEGWQR